MLWAVVFGLAFVLLLVTKFTALFSGNGTARHSDDETRRYAPHFRF
jgi:hypothetical protein